MYSRIIATAAAVALAAVTLSACGSDDGDAESASSSKGSAAAATGPKLTGEPIVIGSLCSCSGPQASSFGSTAKTLEGWAAWKNANGGVNGHPVKVTVLDDGSNATKALQLVKRLIQTEKVMAIVGEQSLVDVAWADYVAKKGVPVIGAASYNTTFMTTPGFYTTGAQTPALVYGLVEQAKKTGKTKLAVMPCAESPACAQFPPLIQAMGKIVGGVEMVYQSKVTATQPSYTANCLAARSKGADAMIVLENAATVMRVADQCAQQGYKPLQLNLSATTGRSWAENPNMEGAITTQPQPVLADESIPATKAFHEALEQYAPDVPSSKEYNESNLWTWAAGETFALAAERAKLTPKSTAADVIEGLHTFENETVGGLTPPLTFKKTGPSPLVPCYFTTVIDAGEFTAPQGAKPTCLPPEKVKALGAVLAA